ncbi:ankyrin repeat domain-containing protein [Spirillospora sp. NBC_00431]
MNNNAWADVNWRDLASVREALESGVDPDALVSGTLLRPLDLAMELGTPEVVAEVARRVRDVDAEHDGRTALWTAVFYNRPDNARALVEAGADPWRPTMAGWSPGRLSLAGPHPDLFSPSRAELSAAETAAVAEAPRLIEALGRLYDTGYSLACVAGITAVEAARRLGARTVEAPPEYEEYGELGPEDYDDSVVGVTDVPGGCVVVQPWSYAASMPGVTKALSTGTVCYAMFANPKGGNHGDLARDGVIEGWDLSPGGWVHAGNTTEEVLLGYLYGYRAGAAYCCAYVGLRPTDPHSIMGPVDMWLELPDRDYRT